MTDFGLTKGSIKGLGAGAYLVNVLPSAVLTLGLLTLGLLALITSHLYPWSEPLQDTQGREVSPGSASIINSLGTLGALGAVLLALAILITTVLMRPFQISAVQWLEGYWSGRRAAAPFLALAVERHTRRRSLLIARSREVPQIMPTTAQFGVVASHARIYHRADNRKNSAEESLANYPDQAEHIMPTLLGNILRRAETSAGERYGLNTVVVYPHLYPYFSPPFNQEVQTQLNILDTASTLTIVDGFLAVAASPLLVRGDAWSLIPAGLILIAAIAYQGAKSAAGRHAIHLSAAFDLHRFDMLRAMHRQLPENAVDEYADNEKLCRVLAGRRPIDEPEPECRVYIHPSPTKEENLDSEITVSREEST